MVSPDLQDQTQEGNRYGVLTDLHFGVFGVLSAQALVEGDYERAVML